MREMKDSGIEWIGEIPKEWKVCRLKQISSINSGDMIAKNEYVDSGDYAVIGSNGEIGRTNKFNNEKRVLTTGRVGTIGTVCIVEKCWITDNALVIDTNENIDYLKYVIPNFDFAFMSSGTAQPLITGSNLGEQHIPCPETEIQSRIADYLDKKCAEIDALIAAKKKTNALLKERRQSIIYEAVTKGLDLTAPMKDSGIEWIGKIPEGWNVKKIKYLAKREPNSFVDGDWIDSPYIIDEGIRYLTSGNIGDGEYKEQGNGHITEDTFNALNCTYAYPGDLVFSRLNTPYGRACILPDICSEYVLAVDNVILRTGENKRFITYLTQCAGYHHEVEGKANGTAMKRISRTDLGNISLPLAPQNVQTQIADYLDEKCAEIDAVVNANESTIEKLKEYRQSVIYEAVTGKVEV